MSAQNTVGIDKNKLPCIKPPGPPKVWEVIKKLGKDGRPIKFTIQEIPEDRHEDVLQHMCTYFLADEPTCETMNAVNDPVFIENSKVMWRQMLEQGICVGVFVDNPDGGKPIIAGLNMLGVDFKENESSINDIQFTSDNLKALFTVMMDLSKKAEVYEYYGVDKYMLALGLSVAPAYRGCGLSVHILKAREKIGREYNIPVTSTAFTSLISQKSAERAGFEVLLEKDYVDIVNENGKEYFPGIRYKTLKIMAKRLI